MSIRLAVANIVLFTLLGCGNLSKVSASAPGTPNTPNIPKAQPVPSSEAWSCDPLFYEDLPSWTAELYRDARAPTPIKRYHTLVPGALEGDFDGDGELDVAVAVSSCEGGEIGVAILLQEPPAAPRVLGVGDGTDLGWIEYWFVTHDPNTPDLLDLNERCTLGVTGESKTLELDCSS